MKVLELFAGTRSVSRAFEQRGHETYSVDWDEQFDVTLHADISKLTAKDIVDLCGGVPDVWWNSFDCTSYSTMAISHHRERERDGTLTPKSEYAKFCDMTNSHVIDLIKELNPKLYFIENPVGALRKMSFMKGIPRYTVTYCFAGETEVITQSGVRTLAEMVNQTVPLLTPEGWKESKIREYGIQKLMKLTLSRAKRHKEIYVTADHKWILKNGKVVSTVELKKGNKLAYCKPALTPNLTLIPEFVARGFAFGDGYIVSTQPTKKGYVMFCGEKKEMIPYFDGFCGKSFLHSSNTSDIIMRYGYPRHWKTELPTSEWSANEKFSWIAGYLSADGTVGSKNGQITLSSANINNLICVRDRCREIGIDTYGITTTFRKGYCDTERPIHVLTFMRSDVPEEMIIRQKHKNAYHSVRPPKHQARRWSVIAVEKTDRIEQTYCAEVPDVHQFTLNDGILTHNCQYGDFRQKPTDIWTNHPNPDFKPMCKRGAPCHMSAPRGSKSGTQLIKGARDRARLPDLLCQHIVDISEEYIGKTDD